MPTAARFAALAALICLPLAADIYTDPAAAGPDYLVQGEYRAGRDEAAPWAAQIMALGEGRFRLYLLRGGLPGDGWDQQPPSVLTGSRDDDTVPFINDAGEQATWTAGRLRGTGPDGAAYVLTRVERVSPTLGAEPPADAVVLFDGTNTTAWATGKMDDQQRLTALSGPLTKEAWQDFELHLEFQVPFNPTQRGQNRANSGVYVQRRYELQIGDSFGNFEAAPRSGEVCGELYRSVPALINAALPPLVWQTLDVTWHAPLWSAEGEKTAPARLTAKLNGVTIHEDLAVPGKTGAGQPEGPQALPLYLQDHGSPVFFRNVWLRPLAPQQPPPPNAAP